VRRPVGGDHTLTHLSLLFSLQASLASGVVDVCLIPEVPFALDGQRGLAAFLRKKLADRGHAVVCIAEGAGQDLLGTAGGTDASGNPLLSDIGAWLKRELKTRINDADIKYIDPSYMIRATTTTASDRVYCKILAHNAVHAAFAGYTGKIDRICWLV
jgi:6-phosphofructokinase 1